MNTLNSLYSIWNNFLVLFRNGHFHNVFSTFTNVVKLNVENGNIVSTLSNPIHINIEIHNVDSMMQDFVNSNVEIHNIVSMLVWSCPTLRRHINQKTTLKQCWNVCWDSVSHWLNIIHLLFEEWFTFFLLLCNILNSLY